MRGTIRRLFSRLRETIRRKRSRLFRFLSRRLRGFDTPFGGFPLGPPEPYEVPAMDWLSMKADHEIGDQLGTNPDDYRWGTSRQGYAQFLTKDGRVCTHRNEFLLVKLEQTGPK